MLEHLELRPMVEAAKKRRAQGIDRIKTEHIKVWLVGMIREEKCGKEDAGDNWRKFVALVQSI
jgi:hypothetical protein